MEYKVGLVADLIGGQKDKPASGKLADLFTGKSTVNTPNKTQQQSKATKSAKAKSKSTSKKLKRSQPSGETASSEHGDAACTSSLGPSSQAPGFSPPPGIVHESLAASNPIQLPGGKRKKKSTEDDSDTETQNAQTKRPRRDRLKKASEKRTVFVGNVPLSCSKKKLTKMFREFGEVENVRFRCAPVADPSLPKRVAVITKEFHDQRHNISAYVCFKEKDSAKEALNLNGHVIDGLHIRVDSAAPSKTHDNSRSVFVGNLPFSIEEESVRTHFEDCGDVENVRIIRDRKTNLGKGFCYILFKSKDSVSLALKLQNSKLQGRELRIERCSEHGASQHKKKTKSASASASAHPRKPAASADALKFKRPKFWQPTNSVTAGHRPKSMKNKKLKKAQLKKKHKKVDDVTRVLGPHKTATGSGKRMKTSQRGGQSTGLKNKRKGRPGGKK